MQVGVSAASFVLRNAVDVLKLGGRDDVCRESRGLLGPGGRPPTIAGAVIIAACCWDVDDGVLGCWCNVDMLLVLWVSSF